MPRALLIVSAYALQAFNDFVSDDLMRIHAVYLLAHCVVPKRCEKLIVGFFYQPELFAVSADARVRNVEVL